MPLFRLFRARRLPALIASLALFVLGSNYCLLGAWAGDADMACLSLPKVATSAPAKCHHCLPPAGREPARGETPTPSCCPAPVVTTPAPTLDRDTGATQALAMVVDLSSQSLPIASAWHGHRALPDGRPPTRLARAPLPARAPPLA
jgi:hypothetical protein